MSLVCFVSSLFKYMQTAIQILGQRSALVKPAGAFTVWDHKISSCFSWQSQFPALQSVRRLDPKKKRGRRACWNISWRLLINLLFLWIHFLQRRGSHLPNLKLLPMILVVTLCLHLIWNFIKQLYCNLIPFIHWWMSVNLINIKKNCDCLMIIA